MNLTVIDATGDRTEQVSVPDDVAAGRIAIKLVELMGLPASAPNGRPLAYKFHHERSSRQIDDEETLAGAGVSENDVLRLVAVTAVTSTPVDQDIRAVVSPVPPELASSPTAPSGWRTPSITIAAIVLGCVVVGAAVAIAVGGGGGRGAHLVANTAGEVTATAASPGSEAATTPAEAGGETGEETTEEDSTTATTAEGALPAVSAQQMQSEIQQMLLSWHEDVVNGNYRVAWNLLSQRKRAQDEHEQGYATWAKNQSTLRPYLHPAGLQVSIESTEPGSGVAQVDVTGMTWSKPGASCTEWSGITWVKYEDGGWRYDPGYSTTPEREHEWKPRFSELLGGSC